MYAAKLTPRRSLVRVAGFQNFDEAKLEAVSSLYERANVNSFSAAPDTLPTADHRFAAKEAFSVCPPACLPVWSFTCSRWVQFDPEKLMVTWHAAEGGKALGEFLLDPKSLLAGSTMEHSKPHEIKVSLFACLLASSPLCTCPALS